VQINLGARITFLDLGGFRSEWRTDFSLLSTYGITSEYYRPFTPDSRWFIAPRVQAINFPLNLYHENKEIAEYRIGQYGGGLDFGYQFNRNSEVRLGYSALYENGSLRIGGPVVNASGGRLSGTKLSYTFDGTDSPLIPRSGTYLTGSFQYTDSAPGAPTGFPVAQLSALYFKPVSKPASVFVTAAGGTTFGHNATGLPPFFLGGPLRLGAYGTNEILTNQYFLFRAGYLREIGRVNPLLGEKIFAIGFYEIAKPYGGYSPSRLPNDINGGLIVNTLLGPILVGGAWGDTGHHKIYFELGRIF
jgi:NTE family protein